MNDGRFVKASRRVFAGFTLAVVVLSPLFLRSWCHEQIIFYAHGLIQR
jgi:hypothetical protein